MKRSLMLLMMLILLFSICPSADAIVLPPRGADYEMGELAPVLYRGAYYPLQSANEWRYLSDCILEENHLPPAERGLEGPMHFMNGKIYYREEPNGLEGCDWLLTEEEYVYENGRYQAFCRQLPQAVSWQYRAFEDFDTSCLFTLDYRSGSDQPIPVENRLEPSAPWYAIGVVESVREGYFQGERIAAPESELGYVCYLRPEATMTRAEVVTTIMRSSLPKTQNYDGCYQDLVQAAWYGDFVKRAYEAGLLERGDLFQPNAPATREFVAQMLSHLVKQGELSELSFSDSASISPNSLEGIRRLCQLQVLQGYPDNTFRPKQTVTRAEYAVMLGRLIEGDLLSVDTPNRAFAKAYTQAYFEAYPDQAARNRALGYTIFIDHFGEDIPYPIY